MPTLVTVRSPVARSNGKPTKRSKPSFLNRLEALLPLHGLYLPMHGAMFVEGMQDRELIGIMHGPPGGWAGLSSFGELRSPWQHQPADYRHARHAVGVSPQRPTSTAKRPCSALPTFCFTACAEKIPSDSHVVSRSCPDARRTQQLQMGAWKAPVGTHCANAQSRARRHDVSMLVGYVWADEPRSTAAVVITGTAPDNQRRVTNLAQQYWDARAEFKFGTETCTVDDCVQRAIDMKTQPAILATRFRR